MIYRDIAKSLIKKHEGLRLKAYRCTADVPTIGYGHTEGISEADVKNGKTITAEEAEALLEKDLNDAVEIAEYVFFSFPNLTPNRKAVLVDMAFNLGQFRLGRFKRLRAAVNVGDYEWASEEMLSSLWAKQVKGRALTLAGMMRTG